MLIDKINIFVNINREGNVNIHKDVSSKVRDKRDEARDKVNKKRNGKTFTSPWDKMHGKKESVTVTKND